MDLSHIKQTLIARTEIKYLDAALDKLSSPPHPNFTAALKAKRKGDQHTKTEVAHALVRLACARALDAKLDPKEAVLAIKASLAKTNDKLTYTMFFKQLMRQVAFQAHMDCVAIERAEAPQLDELVEADVNDEVHELDLGDISSFDLAGSQRNAPREQQQVDTIASSVQEAFDAVTSIQAWIDIAFSNDAWNRQPANGGQSQAEFWGVDAPFPLDQDAGNEYAPIRDFEDYRAYAKSSWLAKRNAIPRGLTEDALMRAA